MPKLAEAIAETDAFLLLVGPSGLGPWQAIEYMAAFDRRVTDGSFPLVPVIAADATAPGILFLRTLKRRT